MKRADPRDAVDLEQAGDAGLGVAGVTPGAGAEALFVLAPHGRDAAVIVSVLRKAGVRAEVVADVAGLAARIDEAAAVVVTEEALSGAGLAELLAWVGRQPPWSDLAFIVLVTRQAVVRTLMTGGAATGAGLAGAGGRASTIEALGNATLMERPLNAESLGSAGRSAMRARRRQLAMRDLALSLESRVEARTQELTESEMRFRAVFEGFPACLFVVRVLETAAGDGPGGRDFEYEGYNPAGEQYTGLCHDDIVGKPPEAFMPPGQAAMMRAALERCVATGAGVQMTERMEFPAGEGTFEISLTPMPNAEGRIVRILGVANDVTERNRLEQRLRQAQKLEAVGQLTGGVAHDFNNLLQVVLSGLTLMERVQDPVRRAQLAESVRRAAQRGGELTKRLLTVARRQSLKPEAVDLDAWLHDGAGELLARTLRGDIATELRIDAGLPPVQVDPEELELAVLNLAVNARDAMPDGGTLVIGAEAVVLDEREAGREVGEELGDVLRGRFVRLSVGDTGAGMSAATLARVFEPFFTTKEVGKGTGLGLAQVYGFAKQSGGSVRLKSEVGVGTTVSLLLPVSRDAVVVAAVPAGVERRGEPLVGAAVLVVEDDDEVASLVMAMLSQLGQRATRVTNAAGALGVLAGREPVDLLFTDVLMPGGMDGLALAREAGRRRPGLPVLLTTGYSGGGAAAVPLGLPVLRKPYRIDELASALQKVLAVQAVG